MEQQQHTQLHQAYINGHPKTSLPSPSLPHQQEKIYRGIRHRSGHCEVCVVEPSLATPLRRPATSSRPLPLHLELRNHSPTGFAWGYGGSGPAQLALAILMDATGEQALALRFYQEFKFYFVAGWGDSWCITQAEVFSFLASREHPVTCRSK